MEFRFSLEKGSKKHQCPACGKSKQFVRYKDNQTGKYLPHKVGRCERIIKCGYHYKPADYFRDHPSVKDEFQQYSLPFVANPIIPTKPDFISPSLVAKSLKHYESNHFTIWLESLFGPKATQGLIERFRIGSSKRWPGATIFWQLDINLQVRSGKIMLYNPTTGSRKKNNDRAYIDWVHSILLRNGKLKSFELKQCLFGEHQLAFEPPGKQVAIVESEKTAIVMSIILPEFIWMACGSAANIKTELFQELNQCPIILYPDLGCYELWTSKVYELKQAGFNIYVSGLLEEKATDSDKSNGFDLADFFIKRDNSGWVVTDGGYPLFWDL